MSRERHTVPGRHTRRIGAAAAVAGLALALLPASSASAVTPPDWPTSRVPSGCPITALAGAGSGFTVTYADGITPTVAGWTINSSTKRGVLLPGVHTVAFRIKVRQSCGGVGVVQAFARQSVNGGAPGALSPLPSNQLTTNAFDATFGLVNSSSVFVTGWIEVPLVLVQPRYDSFTLDQDFGLVSNVAYSGGNTYLSGSWSTQRVYIVLATTQVATATRTTVAKGGSVTFTTTVKAADLSGYVARPGAAVRFQTKLPGKPWVTRATKTTSATGKASYTFAPGATMAWRWVHAENITTAPYTAASTSTVKTIAVT